MTIVPISIRKQASLQLVCFFTKKSAAWISIPACLCGMDRDYLTTLFNPKWMPTAKASLPAVIIQATSTWDSPINLLRIEPIPVQFHANSSHGTAKDQVNYYGILVITRDCPPVAIVNRWRQQLPLDLTNSVILTKLGFSTKSSIIAKCQFTPAPIFPAILYLKHCRSVK